MFEKFRIAAAPQTAQIIDMPKIYRTSNRRQLELVEFSRRLTASIEALGYTKAAFARSIGIERGRLHPWLRGGTYPDTEKLLEMDRTHGLSPDWLLAGRMTGLPADLAKKIQNVYQRMREE